MAVRAIWKWTVSFSLVHIVSIQVSIVRQEEANHLGIREVSRVGGGC
jgi:non-homologous end joining protein Ku